MHEKHKFQKIKRARYTSIGILKAKIECRAHSNLTEWKLFTKKDKKKYRSSE